MSPILAALILTAFLAIIVGTLFWFSRPERYDDDYSTTQKINKKNKLN